ncbi:MAG: citrate/2-methylcitrate synthase [Myxococcota bacterium]
MSRTMTSTEAADCLGVKRATLYSYVARGLVRAVAEPGGGKRYVAADVFALKRRSAAAKGHAAAASVALDWGAPVLSTAISAVDRDGPSYRGRSAWTLAERDTPFEEVARGLWHGFGDDPSPFAVADSDWIDAVARVGPSDVPRALRLAAALADAEAPEPLLDGLVQSVGCVRGHGRDPGGSVAERLLAIHGLDLRWRWLVDRALVLCADHELNASTFAARVAASTGASLADALMSALGAFFGPRHGAQVPGVAALVAEAGTDPAAAARTQVQEGRLRGFGHPLYPDGDPRAEALLGWIREQGGLDEVFAWIDGARREGAPPPSVDVGLVALARAVGGPAGFGMTVFALGRAAGWMAHAREQREIPGILRPRARYVGP